MGKKSLRKEMLFEAYPDEVFVLADGYEEAIVGIDTRTHQVIYNLEKVVSITMKRDGMDDEEAREFLEFNTFCAYVGEKTPIFMEVI